MGKRDLETRSADERDGNQRSLGFVGLSAIAHSALLIAILLAPSLKTQMGETAGQEAGATLEMKGGAPSAQTTSSADASTTLANQPTEVMLADANDPTAVEMPTEVEPQPVAKIETPKPAKPAPAKVEKAPAVKPAVIEGDVAIDQALAESRKPVPTEEETPVTKHELKPVETKLVEADTSETAEPTKAVAEEKPEVTAEAVQPVAEQPEETKEIAAAAPAVVNLPEKGEAPAEQPAPVVAAAPVQASAPTAATNSGMTSSANPTNGKSAAGPIAQQGSQSGTAKTNSIGAAPTNIAAIPPGTAIRDARSLIAMPGNPKPAYPLPDKLAGRQGTAVLLGRVKPDGSMAEVALERSSGSRMMDESAAKAFKSWRYKPGQEGLVRLPVQFQLVGNAQEIPAQLHRQ